MFEEFGELARVFRSGFQTKSVDRIVGDLILAAGSTHRELGVQCLTRTCDDGAHLERFLVKTSLVETWHFLLLDSLPVPRQSSVVKAKPLVV
jgi:hypothetical protein